MRRFTDENRLFGDSRPLVAADDAELSGMLAKLLGDEADRTRRAAIGRERIGGPGANDQIIASLM
jgi:hypothetical protein